MFTITTNTLLFYWLSVLLSFESIFFYPNRKLLIFLFCFLLTHYLDYRFEIFLYPFLHIPMLPDIPLVLSHWHKSLYWYRRSRRNGMLLFWLPSSNAWVVGVKWVLCFLKNPTTMFYFIYFSFGIVCLRGSSVFKLLFFIFFFIIRFYF